jgi:adenosylhomocysteine nucleosidase
VTPPGTPPETPPEAHPQSPSGVELLIVVALRAELKGIARGLRLRRRDADRYADTGGRMQAVCVGPGAAAEAATRRWLAELRPRRVLHAGYCGGLEVSLSPGAVVRAGRVVNDATGDAIELDAGDALLVTTAEPVLTPEGKRRLAERWHAAAVDTESHHVASACREAGVPCEVVRAVTDTAEEALNPAIVELVDASGRTRPLAVLRLALTRPALLPRLARLGRQSRRADATLAACAEAAFDRIKG